MKMFMINLYCFYSSISRILLLYYTLKIDLTYSLIYPCNYVFLVIKSIMLIFELTWVWSTKLTPCSFTCEIDQDWLQYIVTKLCVGTKWINDEPCNWLMMCIIRYRNEHTYRHTHARIHSQKEELLKNYILLYNIIKRKILFFSNFMTIIKL